MKILINCLSLNSTGPVQVALSFLEESKNINHDFYVILGPATKELLKINEFPDNFKFYFSDILFSKGVKNIFMGNRFLKKIENEIKPEIVFSVFGPAYWKPKAKHIQGFANPHDVYPDSPYYKFVSFKRRLSWAIHRFVHLFLIWVESDAVILETKVMEKRLKRFIPKVKTYVVNNTFSSAYSNFKANVRHKPDSYFKLVTLCSYKRHKNLEIIPLVVDELNKLGIDNVRFFVTLKQEKYNQMFPVKYREYIINLGLLHPNDCPVAYDNSDCMFLPTLLEGFSASYPEAMYMGKPILTSNYDFAVDICGDSALYFDPLCPRSIAKSIKMVIQDKQLRERLVGNGYERLKSFGNATYRANQYIAILENNV